MLEKVKTWSLIVMGVTVSVAMVIIIVVVLSLYSNVNQSVQNIEEGSESAVDILADVETVSNDMVAVSTHLRNAAGRIDAALGRVEESSENIGETVANIRASFSELDLATTDLAGRIKETREQITVVSDLVEDLRDVKESIGR